MASASVQRRSVGAAPVQHPSIGSGSDRLARESANGAAAGTETVARRLGWFSLGLGLAQVIAPHKVAEIVGLDDGDRTRAIVRAAGVREIASGLGILTRSRPTPWLWARVGGDALDLALLSSAMNAPGADRHRLTAATAAVVGLTVVDALSSARLGAVSEAPRETEEPARAVPVTAAITVNAPIGQVFQAWEGFRNLPRFMADSASVQVVDDATSRWSASLPAELSLDWTVRITESIPNERIAWQTGGGSPMTASGEVRFRSAPGNRGTEVLFQAEFTPPGGELGQKIGGLFSDAIGQQIQNDLRHFKQLTELGEIVLSDDSLVKGPNPARPARPNGPA